MPHTTRFCRATDPIGSDMKGRLIAKDRGICQKSGPLTDRQTYNSVYLIYSITMVLAKYCKMRSVDRH